MVSYLTQIFNATFTVLETDITLFGVTITWLDLMLYLIDIAIVILIFKFIYNFGR